jgi:DNA-directed RNA polymerase subunit E'/Rpb7
MLVNYNNLKLVKPYVELIGDLALHVEIVYDAFYFLPKKGEIFCTIIDLIFKMGISQVFLTTRFISACSTLQMGLFLLRI